jgi:hypothetical protein
MKQVFAGQHYDTIEDIFMAVEAFLGELLMDLLETVFQEWIQ